MGYRKQSEKWIDLGGQILIENIHWTCPFCKATASKPVEAYGLTTRRICDCGAVGFSALVGDQWSLLHDVYEYFDLDKTEANWDHVTDVIMNLQVRGYVLKDGDHMSSYKLPHGGWSCHWVKRGDGNE